MSAEESVTDVLTRAAQQGAQTLGVAAAAVALERGLPLAVLPAGRLDHVARSVGVATPVPRPPWRPATACR